MNYKFNFYILLTILVIFIFAFCAYYIVNKNENSLDKKSVSIYYGDGSNCTSELDYLKRERSFKTFNLTADTILDNKVIVEFKTELNRLKQTNDSTNGVKLVLTNDTPYKYYLQAVEICKERRPRHFLSLENEIYAYGMSKSQLVNDSLMELQEKGSLEIIDENFNLQ